MTSTTPPRSDPSGEWTKRRLTPDLAAWQGGAGPDLLLVHGVGLRAEAWRFTIPALCERFRVTAVDLPGHGESPPLADGEGALGDYVRTVGGALSQLGGPALVVGHSMGAMIALELASRATSAVSAVVAVNAIFRRCPEASAAVRTRAEELASGAETDPSATLVRWFGDAPKGPERTMAEDCRRWLMEIDRSAYSRAYRVFAAADGPAEADLAGLGRPALFVTGADEPNSTPAMSLAMAERAPRGGAVVMDRARHMLPMTHGSQLAEHIIEFATDCGVLDG